MTYTMLATRYNETIKSERTSAYITLSKARVWLSEGWTVSITDDDGKTFSVTEFESRVSGLHRLPVTIQEAAIVPDEPMSRDAEAAVGERPDAGADNLVAV